MAICLASGKRQVRIKSRLRCGEMESMLAFRSCLHFPEASHISQTISGSWLGDGIIHMNHSIFHRRPFQVTNEVYRKWKNQRNV